MHDRIKVRVEMRPISEPERGLRWWTIRALSDDQPYAGFPERTACLTDAAALELLEKCCRVIRRRGGKADVHVVREVA